MEAEANKAGRPPPLSTGSWYRRSSEDGGSEEADEVPDVKGSKQNQADSEASEDEDELIARIYDNPRDKR